MSSPSRAIPCVASVAAQAPSDFFAGGMEIASSLAIVAVLLQMITNGRYGYFRDELYSIATSDHLDWGYVDFAPLSSLLLKICGSMFGTSLHALRLLPALAFGASVLLTGLIARELGGRPSRSSWPRDRFYWGRPSWAKRPATR